MSFREVTPFRFNPKQTAELGEIVRRKAEDPELKAYAADLESSVAVYAHLKSRPRDRSAPVEQLKRLRSLAKASADLEKAMKQLEPSDANWLRQVLGIRAYVLSGIAFDPSKAADFQLRHSFHNFPANEASTDPSRGGADERDWLQRFGESLSEFVTVARSAAAVEHKPTRGRPPDEPRILLVQNVARAYFALFKKKPPKSRSSAFERSVRLCLRATGIRDDVEYQKDLHDLIVRTLSRLKFD